MYLTINTKEKIKFYGLIHTNWTAVIMAFFDDNV